MKVASEITWKAPSGSVFFFFFSLFEGGEDIFSMLTMISTYPRIVAAFQFSHYYCQCFANR